MGIIVSGSMIQNCVPRNRNFCKFPGNGTRVTLHESDRQTVNPLKFSLYGSIIYRSESEIECRIFEDGTIIRPRIMLEHVNIFDNLTRGRIRGKFDDLSC